MDAKTASLLGAAAALATLPAAAQAAPAEVGPLPVAASYAELLQPIPNAVERLQASYAADQEAHLIDVQYGPGPLAHHHHHSQYNTGPGYGGNGQGYDRHHHSQYNAGPGYGGNGQGYDRHHHHHHNQWAHRRAWYLRHGYVWTNGGWVMRPRWHRHHHHHHHNNNY